MEIALHPDVPTYSGGLGVLAGDTIRSAADLCLDMVAVTLVYHKGYVRQKLTPDGVQLEEPEVWSLADHLTDTGVRATLPLHDRSIAIRIWRFDVRGFTGHVIPVFLLDSNLPENSAEDQSVTDLLYGGDLRYRLLQEAVLGLGGLAALAALGRDQIELFHMNEGHSALLTLGLLEHHMRESGATAPSPAEVLAVRRRCVFTTHTPVPAGHDHFNPSLVGDVLGSERAKLLELTEAYHEGELNMTYLALRFSHYVNGVAMKHGEVSRMMFHGYAVRAITNGVHAQTWTSPAFAALYDRHIPEWRRDPMYLRYVCGIPVGEIAEAHANAKKALLAEVRQRTGVALDPAVFTIGFARRAAKYKRATLLFSDIDRLRAIAQTVGPLQVLYAGKAHPHDQEGKQTIRRVFEAAEALRGVIQVVYLENYEWRLAQLLTSGSDVWLNTPQRPQEASGTSGMKAALNGVPSFSILDGWWIEGCVEGVTGWAIGSQSLPLDDQSDEIASLYGKLERVVLPLFYSQPEGFLEMRRSAIALNGSFFNTERMVDQYVANAYAEDHETAMAGAEGAA